MRRLVASGLLPKAGRATAQSLGAHLPGRAEGDGRRIAAGKRVDRRDADPLVRPPREASGGAARTVAYDAAITPIVTGDVNPGVLDSHSPPTRAG